MSFSQLQKDEILNQKIKSSSQRRAILNGILFAKGTVCDGYVSISLENDDILEYTKRLIKEFYGRDTEFKAGLPGRRRVIVFFSNSAHQFVSSIEEKASEEIATPDTAEYACFLKGITLACARISDPEKSYLLEFATVRPFALMSFFSDNGIVTKMSERKNETVLYIKQGDMISDFFAVAGMNHTVFALMNAKIKSEINNSTNRITNCEINNINKAVSAAAKQIEAIKIIEEANLFSTLPEELYETAMLRMEHKDMSLTQLAAVAVPKISKPGLSHRLNKIMEIAEKVKNKEDIN